MAEIIDEEQEKEFKVRIKSKRHIRAILIIINLLLVGYFAYYISDAVVDYFQKRTIILLLLMICPKQNQKNFINV